MYGFNSPLSNTNNNNNNNNNNNSVQFFIINVLTQQPKGRYRASTGVIRDTTYSKQPKHKHMEKR
jgi:hypothetical protein